MNALEDQLRTYLAERAVDTPIDPEAWDKTVARSHRRLRLSWPGWLPAGLAIPVAAAVAVVAVVLTATAVTGGLGGHHASPSRPAAPPATQNAGPKPPGAAKYVIQQIPPVTPFTRLTLPADHHTVRDFLWFGHLPGYARLGLALCQYNQGGVYDGYSGCTSGTLPAGALAHAAAADGSGWIRIGVAAPQVTSVRAVLPGGHTVAGVVRAARGAPDKVWAITYSPDLAVRLVFGDAAGREVAHLNLPSDNFATPARPGSGGIKIYEYAGQWVTAYRIGGGQIGYWWGGSSIFPGQILGQVPVPVSQAPLSMNILGHGPAYWFGYAPADAARVTIRLADGKQYSTATRPGWPGSGIRICGPVGPIERVPGGFDTIVITYDAAGHVLQEVPLIFLG